MVNRGSHGAIALVRQSRAGGRLEKGGKGTRGVKEDTAGLWLASRAGGSRLQKDTGSTPQRVSWSESLVMVTLDSSLTYHM